jgi:hypothetical protein
MPNGFKEFPLLLPQVLKRNSCKVSPVVGAPHQRLLNKRIFFPPLLLCLNPIKISPPSNDKLRFPKNTLLSVHFINAPAKDFTKYCRFPALA